MLPTEDETLHFAGMQIMPLGDCALRVEFGREIEPRTHAHVQAACAALDAATLPGVREIVPAYTTLTLHYDPTAVVAAGAPPDDLVGWLGLRIEQIIARGAKAAKARRQAITIPVCYGGTFGPDLEKLATRAKLSVEEFIRRHTKQEYWVAMIGFAPGFPYLAGLPQELSAPRLAKPRALVAPGSVGIAGVQTGIYPIATPGGWNLIGRTPLRLFLPEQNPPTLLQTGDRVQFRAITPAEFAKLETTS